MVAGCRGRLTLRNIFIVLLLVVLYNEFFIHRLQWRRWRTLDCRPGDETCTKLLLVADPQVQGELAVQPPLSYLFNWDSDRHIKDTFTAAIDFFKPDILVFLGDLTDEGSISSKIQFQRYIRRLSEIFDTNQSVMQVWIPGDNDIGGEHERIAFDKVREFEAAFNQPDVLVFPKNVVVYKVNRITHTMPKLPFGHLVDEEAFNILVSHYPLLGTGLFAQKAMDDLHADLIFSAHDHIAKYVVSPKGAAYSKTIKILTPAENMLEVNFNNSTNHEIIVPTCSYRMGVPRMGYGVAVLDNNNQRLRYDVLWSSGRFPILFFYLGLLIVFVCYIIIYYANVICLRRSAASNA